MANFEIKVSLLDEILEFLVSTPTPEAIIALRPSALVQTRIEELLDRNRNALLTTEEKAELDKYLELDQFMTLLKAHARKKLMQQ